MLDFQWNQLDHLCEFLCRISIDAFNQLIILSYFRNLEQYAATIYESESSSAAFELFLLDTQLRLLSQSHQTIFTLALFSHVFLPPPLEPSSSWPPGLEYIPLVSFLKGLEHISKSQSVEFWSLSSYISRALRSS